MIRAVVAAVVVLIFSATTALSFQANADVKVAIDAITTGNTATSLGAEDACVSVNEGDTFEIDITVMDVPPVQADLAALGLAGYSYNLHFDPNVVHVIQAQNNMMVNASAPFDRIEANFTNGAPNPLPATTGNMRVDFADISEDYENGDGVLSRLTLQAVGPGTTILHLQEDTEGQPAPVVWMAGGFAYAVGSLQDAVVSVGAPCDAASVPTPFDPPDTFASPAPSPTPEPTPTPTLGPSDVPEGDTSVSVDAVPTGNTATTVAQIDECASATVGDNFSVDVVIQDVEDLLGWEAPVSYDPAVLKIVDHNVKLFLAGNEGSSVFDASNQTPNTSGFYRAGAVDQADPPATDSGSGVLIRLTFTAIRNGTSPVAISAVDLNNDGTIDTGVLLKNQDNQAIGGPIFRGPTKDAEIRVGEACPDGGAVVPTQAPGEGPGDNGGTTDDGGSSNTWIYIVIAAAAVVVLGGGAALLLRRRKSGGAPTAEA